MKLTLEGISDRKEWEQKGYKLPEYNIEKMRENTKSKPFWIHFGAGNLFRAFHARVVQNDFHYYQEAYNEVGTIAGKTAGAFVMDSSLGGKNDAK